MIVVDTNVVSEFMGTPPKAAVLSWLNKQEAANLYVTAITVAEIQLGLSLMPEGRRQNLMGEEFEQFLTRGFASRVLSFDEKAARVYAEIRSHRIKIGRPVTTLDAQIAAIARSNTCSVATRNLRDFQDCGIELIMGTNGHQHKF